MAVLIGDRLIGKGFPVFIVSEIGINHNGKVSLAKRLIDGAKQAGADAVKFQVYRTHKFVDKKLPTAAYQKTAGFDTQYKMLKDCELSPKQFESLARYAEKRRIIFLATPHSCKEDVDLVAKLCPAIKVGSGSMTNFQLLEYIGTKRKPVILSTGMASIDEIRDAIWRVGKNVILLQCTSEYPCPPRDVNLSSMIALKLFKRPIGFSDHTESLSIPALAVAFGACMVEKHMTYDKKARGPDHSFSLTPDEFKVMVRNIRDAEEAVGTFWKGPTKEELKIRELIRCRGQQEEKE